MSFSLSRCLLLIIALLAISIVVAGQSDTIHPTLHPTVFLSDGDLWSYMTGNDSPTQLTTTGYNSDMVLSPNGENIAYLSIAPHIIDAHENGNYFFDSGLADPKNVWIFDRITGVFIQISTQENRNPDARGIARSRPAWSPDSTQLAWLEFETYEQGISLVIYDITIQETRIWDDDVQLGFLDGGDFNLPDDLAWGQFISHSVFTYGLPLSEGGAGELVEFRDEGGIVNTHLVRSIEIDEIDGIRWHWVQHNDQWLFAVYGMSTGWQLIDATTGDRYQLENPPYMQTSDDSLQVIWTPEHWLVRLVDNTEISFLAVDSIYTDQQVTLNQAGTAVQYIEDGQLYSWNEVTGTRSLLPETSNNWVIDEVVTMPTIWRTDGNASPIPAPDPYPTPTTNQG